MKLFKVEFYCVLSVAYFLFDIFDCFEHALNKRALLYPKNTVLQLTFGIGIPIVFPNRRQIVYNYGYQQNYDMPYNLSNFMVATYYARSGSDNGDISRESLYVYLMNTLDSLELDGEQCLLRAICEVARTPFHTTKKNNLLEKMAEFIFTPSKCCNFDEDLQEERGIGNLTFGESLMYARNVGLQKGNCAETYSKCSLSIVDAISQKYYLK